MSQQKRQEVINFENDFRFQRSISILCNRVSQKERKSSRAAVIKTLFYHFSNKLPSAVDQNYGGFGDNFEEKVACWHFVVGPLRIKNQSPRLPLDLAQEYLLRLEVCLEGHGLGDDEDVYYKCNGCSDADFGCPVSTLTGH